MVQFTIGVSSFTQKPVACKPVNLVCMTPWTRNWSLASSFGLSVTALHKATVFLGIRVCLPSAGIPTSALVEVCYIVYLWAVL